ncbi:MAG: signal recognition particle-docking protein FtsY [Oligoflexia bacterium]|nr:signal recognition particle-docking protein FtsY [Oligoflexia bacterium]
MGSGNPAADVVILLLLIALLGVLIGILVLYRNTRQERQPGVTQRGYDSTEGRVDKLEINVGEFRSEVSRNFEKFRGEVGYVKQEISEIKTLLRAGLVQPTGAQAEDEGYYRPTQATPEPIAPESSTEPELLERDVQAVDDQLAQTSEVAPEVPSSAVIEAAPESLSKRLTKTRRGLFDKLKGLFGVKPKLEESSLGELEALLVGSDLGVKTAATLLEELKSDVKQGLEVDEGRLLATLKAKVLTILERDAVGDLRINPRKRDGQPLVVLVVGVNGVGKTTTCAKLATMFKEDGARVLLVAADTFRAAAVDQLVEWGKRIAVPVVTGPLEAKPQTVVFDGMTQAKELGVDVVIVDTAGRLHTKSNLMQELEGVRATISKHIPGAPHEAILVVDGATGQNALQQAREFNAATKLSGLIVTKLDGTPKGGIVVAIKDELGIPVRYIGVGEGAKDLRPFVARDFVEALFDRSDSAESGAAAPTEPQAVSAHGEVRRRKRRDTQPYV